MHINISYYPICIYMYIYIYYIYTHITLCFLIIATLLQHIHTLTFTWFYLVIVTSRNSLPNCENYPISNIALKSSYRRCSIKKAVLKNLAILIGMPATLLCRDSSTVVFMWILRKFEKFRYPILKDICERLLLIQSGRNNIKNRTHWNI